MEEVHILLVLYGIVLKFKWQENAVSYRFLDYISAFNITLGAYFVFMVKHARNENKFLSLLQDNLCSVLHCILVLLLNCPHAIHLFLFDMRKWIAHLFHVFFPHEVEEFMCTMWHWSQSIAQGIIVATNKYRICSS